MGSESSYRYGILLVKAGFAQSSGATLVELRAFSLFMISPTNGALRGWIGGFEKWKNTLRAYLR